MSKNRTLPGTAIQSRLQIHVTHKLWFTECWGHRGVRGVIPSLDLYLCWFLAPIGLVEIS